MQVITHAATIQRLQTADAAVSRLQETVDQSLRDKTEAEAKQVGFSLIIAFAELRGRWTRLNIVCSLYSTA